MMTFENEYRAVSEALVDAIVRPSLRAIRRHHRARLKRTRRRYWGRDLAQEPKMLARVVNTKNPCSCLMCGNARRHAGDTMQERRANICFYEA
jgi:hypothetical protein